MIDLDQLERREEFCMRGFSEPLDEYTIRGILRRCVPSVIHKHDADPADALQKEKRAHGIVLEDRRDERRVKIILMVRSLKEHQAIAAGTIADCLNMSQETVNADLKYLIKEKRVNAKRDADNRPWQVWGK